MATEPGNDGNQKPSQIPGYVALVIGIVVSGLGVFGLVKNLTIGYVSLGFYYIPLLVLVVGMFFIYLAYRMLGGKD